MNAVNFIEKERHHQKACLSLEMCLCHEICVFIDTELSFFKTPPLDQHQCL